MEGAMSTQELDRQEDSTPLSGEQIESVLGKGTMGRVGCISGGRVLIVPISYVYDGESIYGCSFDGMKIRAMREHPNVCFEVEQVEKNGQIRTVLVWGDYREQTGEAAESVLELFKMRFERELARRYTTTQGGRHEQAIFYKLAITKKTGRIDRPLRRVAIACLSRKKT